MVLDRDWAQKFAEEWIDAWNAHDLDRILEHYSDDFEMSSPLIVERMGLPEGILRGKEAIREYWRPSMSLNPPLEFELLGIFAGINRATIYYRSKGRRTVAETLIFDSQGKVISAASQWSIR